MSKKLTLMYDKDIMSEPFKFEPIIMVNLKNPYDIITKIKERLVNAARTKPDLQQLVDILDTTNYDITFKYTDPYAAENNEPLVIEKIIKMPKYDDIVDKTNNMNYNIVYQKDYIQNDINNINNKQSGGKKKRTSKKTSKKTLKKMSKKTSKNSKKTSKKKSSKKAAQAGGRKKQVSKKRASKKTSKKSSKKSSRK
jgi:hypothetical protein